MPDADWQALVRSAWNSMRAKVAREIPSAVKGKNLSDQSYRASFGVCSALNSPISRERDPTSNWGDDGEGTLNLTSVRVSDFNGVTAGDIEFSGSEVKLPLPFVLLQATARYGYTQPCALYSLGKKGQTTTVDG